MRSLHRLLWLLLPMGLCTTRPALAQRVADGPIVGPSHWALGLAGGLGMKREIDTDFSSTEKRAVLYGGLGATAMLREVRGPFGIIAMGTALPGWAEVYMARAAIVVGIPHTPHYGWSYTSGSYQITETWSDRIRSVFGLLGGGGFMASPDGLRPHTEFGLAWMGQYQLEFSALFDPVHDSWGGRTAFYGFFGRGAVGGFAGLQIQGLFKNVEDHPAPMMFTFDIGISDGYGMEK